MKAKYENLKVKFCTFPIDFKFIPYDVVTGEEISGINSVIFDSHDESEPLTISGNNIEINPYSTTRYSNNNNSINYIKYSHHISPEKAKAPSICYFEIRKDTYWPYKGSFKLKTLSFTDASFIDLGEIGLLRKNYEDAFVLKWDRHPSNLDPKLLCINGEKISENETKQNDTGLISVDSKFGYGPETILIKRWADLTSNSISKIRWSL